MRQGAGLAPALPSGDRSRGPRCEHAGQCHATSGEPTSPCCLPVLQRHGLGDSALGSVEHGDRAPDWLIKWTSLVRGSVVYCSVLGCSAWRIERWLYCTDQGTLYPGPACGKLWLNPSPGDSSPLGKILTDFLCLWPFTFPLHP